MRDLVNLIILLKKIFDPVWTIVLGEYTIAIKQKKQELIHSSALHCDCHFIFKIFLTSHVISSQTLAVQPGIGMSPIPCLILINMIWRVVCIYTFK